LKAAGFSELFAREKPHLNILRIFVSYALLKTRAQQIKRIFSCHGKGDKQF
jgi:hypothetical protein